MVSRPIASKNFPTYKRQNTWNSFACSLNETVILDAAERIVSLGFKDLGYDYVVIDDCWSAGRNKSGYLVVDEVKFPNGIADVADKVHGLGLKIGIYSSAGTNTCGGYEGSLRYEEKDAALWASWGVSLLLSFTPITNPISTLSFLEKEDAIAENTRSTTSNTTTATTRAKKAPPSSPSTATTQ